MKILLYVFSAGFWIFSSLITPPQALADGFEWRSDASTHFTVVRPHIDAPNRPLLVFEILTQESGCDEFFETKIRARWQANSQEHPQTKPQTLSQTQLIFEGFGTAHADEYQVSAQGPEIELRYPSNDRYNPQIFLKSPLQHTTIERWRWDPKLQTLSLQHRHTPHPQALDAVISQLTSGNLKEARDTLDQLLISAKIGLRPQSDPLLGLFLETTHKLASAHFIKGNPSKAASLILALFQRPPISAAALRPTAQEFFVCASSSNPCDGDFLDFPVTPNTAHILNDCAFILSQTGHNQLAISLFSQVLNFFPNRPPTHLQLADALWETGEIGRSLEHYQHYLDLNGTDLNGTDLNGTDLNGTDLNGTDPNGINPNGINPNQRPSNQHASPKNPLNPPPQEVPQRVFLRLQLSSPLPINTQNLIPTRSSPLQDHKPNLFQVPKDSHG